MDASLYELQIVAVAAPDHGVLLQAHDAPGAVDVEIYLCGWMSECNNRINENNNHRTSQRQCTSAYTLMLWSTRE